jgi:DNA-binding CsgD family transcriptional regulator
VGDGERTKRLAVHDDQAAQDERLVEDEETLADPLDELDAQLSRLRSVADELRGSRGKAVLTGNQVELIEDGPTLLRTYERLQEDAKREVRVLDRPPYVTPPSNQQQLELDRLRAGVCYRAIYGTEVFESQDIMGVLPELQSAGEVSRVLAQVPMKMAVGDDDTALIGLTKRAVGDYHLLIRSSGLLDGLIATFEMLWALSIPMPALPFSGDFTSLRPADRDILLLLAGGATDDKISRHLRISPRTTQRRVRALMESLGAQTRFQAGVQAARRRWI